MNTNPLQDTNSIKLLWTGGWDSTFRLLELILIEEASVQPLYVVDPGRASAPKEFETMNRIREGVAERSKEAAARIRPTFVAQRSDLRRDADITARYRRLKKQGHLGRQYEWLPRFLKHYGLSEVELGIQYGGRPWRFLKDAVEPVTLASGRTNYRLKASAHSTDLALFRDFYFPILHLTKPQMEETARQQGFLDLMEQTWFCFHPTPDGRPCGQCNPCKYVREGGMKRRLEGVEIQPAPLTLTRRIRSFLRR